MKDCSHCGEPAKELVACPCGGPACRSCHDACKREFDDGLESYNPNNNDNYIHVEILKRGNGKMRALDVFGGRKQVLNRWKNALGDPDTDDFDELNEISQQLDISIHDILGEPNLDDRQAWNEEMRANPIIVSAGPQPDLEEYLAIRAVFELMDIPRSQTNLRCCWHCRRGDMNWDIGIMRCEEHDQPVSPTTTCGAFDSRFPGAMRSRK